MRSYHFITGLPRSGSTLLSALLRQNPAMHAGISSPVGELANALLRSGPGGENAGLLSEAKTLRMLRALFDVFYDDVGAAEVVFDNHRQWASQLPLIARFAPDARIIACVRNPAWVMDSLERLVRANPLHKSGLFLNDIERSTVFTRVEALMKFDRMLGFSLAALKDAYYSDEAERMLLLDYDILCQQPAESLRLVYEFIGAAGFEHDLERVQFATPDYDAGLRMPGLHTVRPKVEFRPRRTILPPEVFDQLSKLAFWTGPHPTRAARLLARPAGQG